MMKTKTIKTPLMTALAIGPTSRSSGLVPKSKLLHSPEAQSGFVPKHSHHGGKNLALQAEKLFFSEAVFLPLTMSYVAKQSGVMSWLVRELAHRHKPRQRHRSSES